MDALVMCGGRGTRLAADAEKPLLDVGGRPMVDRVLAALAGSRVGAVHAVTSPHAPETRAHVADAHPGPTIDAPGDGYVADLGYALDRVATPALTAAADLPLLDAAALDAVVDAFAGDSLTVYVPVERKRALGVSVDAATTTTVDGRPAVPAGVNAVADGDRGDTHMTENVQYVVNVNRLRDARVAEVLL